MPPMLLRRRMSRLARSDGEVRRVDLRGVSSPVCTLIAPKVNLPALPGHAAAGDDRDRRAI